MEQDIKTKLNETLGLEPIKSSLKWADSKNLDHPAVIGVIKSLAAQQKILISEPLEDSQTVLTDEGKQVIANNASPEFTLYQSVPEGGVLPLTDAVSKTGMVWAQKNGWITTSKTEDKSTVLQRVKVATEDTWKNCLSSFVEGKPIEKKELETLLKNRKWLITKKVKYFSIEKGPMFGSDAVAVPHITMADLKDGAWKKLTLKPLNFEAEGGAVPSGHLHPLMKVREEYRRIFIELGYQEMETNKFVESSFWNFDSLFQPQQHPARDAHDTFFVSRPEKTLVLPEKLVPLVKQMHEEGGHGSIGWRYKFSDEEPKKNVLRTHTTAVSSRYLYALAQQPQFTPKKYFSIDRVYRNETLDSTHLAEFFQVEGFIADYNISLASLMGAIKEFYQKIGITKIKFKPAYNPYTEPSMEIFGYSAERKGWMEIGNTGIFRPEMLLPLGLPPNVGVAAWGLSLERPTMILYKLTNIRDLEGPKVDLKMVQKNPLCMFV